MLARVGEFCELLKRRMLAEPLQIFLEIVRNGFESASIEVSQRRRRFSQIGETRAFEQIVNQDRTRTGQLFLEALVQQRKPFHPARCIVLNVIVAG